MRKTSIRRKAIALVLIAASLGVTGCQSDADIAAYNIAQEAEYFNINRRVIFYNGITGEYMLTIEGKLSISHQKDQLEVTVKTGKSSFKKHFLGLSDNVTYFCEQLNSSKVSAYHYKVMFKPSVIIPDIDIKL